MSDKPDISEQEKETILAKIHVTMGFSKETLDWFKEIQDKIVTTVQCDKMPSELNFPEGIKIRYGEDKKSLVFIGVMSNEEKDELLKLLLENRSYRGAIGELFEQSQIWFTKEGGNLFFSEHKASLIKSIKSVIDDYLKELKLLEDKRLNIKVKIYDSNPDLKLIIQIIQLIISIIVNKDEIIKFFKELFEFGNGLKDKIKITLNERIKALLKNSAVEEYNISDPLPPEKPIYTDFKIDFSPFWYSIDRKDDIHENISELVHLMFVGLMGAYKEVDNILKEFHDQNNKPSYGFLFIESLLHQPLYGDPPCKDIDDKYKKWVFSPFPHRLIRHSLFVNNEDITKQDILIRFDDSIFTQYIYERWKKGENYYNYNLQFERLNEIFIDGKEIKDPFFAKVQGDIQEDLTKKSSNDPYSKYSLKILSDILKAISLLQFDSRNKPMTSLFIPIASNQIFYGDLFICIPHFHYNGDSDKIKQLASKLLKCVNEHYVPALALIHEHFFEKLVAPQIEEVMKKEVSTLKEIQENCIKILTDPYNLMFCLGQGPLIEYQSSICRRDRDKENRQKPCYSCQHFGWEASSDNVVEKYLHKLWQDRKTGRTNIDESLFFKDYLYTDPKMLNVLERFLKPSKAKLKNLPSVLVVAPTGAGKEDIPKLIKLFTHYYNRGRLYKLNMASLKPDAVVPVAMIGGEITEEENQKYEILNLHFYKEETHKLKGMLQKIRERTRKDFLDFIFKDVPRVKEELDKLNEDEMNQNAKNKWKEEKECLEKLEAWRTKHPNEKELEKNLKNHLMDLSTKEKLLVKELFGKFPTIVLDELNSMNIESQGVLLRFLENAEITPIGGYEDKMLEGGEDEKDYREFITDFLIVGLMNEDPEEITREEAIRFLQKEKYIGGLFGNLLYEHIMKIRRLRPDLRARMMRNGKFEMPKLADHRADIPHAFYRIINDTKKEAYFPNSEIRITMDALEYLMKLELEWNENFRLLEALVNKVVEIIYENKDDKLIVIREKHIRKAMREIGMEKEEMSKEMPI